MILKADLEMCKKQVGDLEAAQDKVKQEALEMHTKRQSNHDQAMKWAQQVFENQLKKRDLAIQRLEHNNTVLRNKLESKD